MQTVEAVQTVKSQTIIFSRTQSYPDDEEVREVEAAESDRIYRNVHSDNIHILIHHPDNADTKSTEGGR